MNFPRKMKNIVLLIRCLAYALLHGTADKISKNISRIIVVPAGKLGDIVCTTPVLSAIRKSLPRTEIIVAGSMKLNQSLLADSGLADAYLELNQGTATAHIKKCNADAALVTGPTFEVTALLYLAGIPFVIAPKVIGGYSPLETAPYKILRHLIKTFPYKMGEYAPRERLRVLEPLGIVTDDTTKHLGFSETAGKKVDQFFIDNGIDAQKDFIVGISPSAGNKIKEWPEERFAEVADSLIEKHGARVMLIGGPNDTSKVHNVLRYISHPEKIINTQGKLTLDELKALISKLKLFVSVDTGPIYIAEAFNTPTIDIIGPMSENEQPPQGSTHRLVLPPSRKWPQLFILNARSYDQKEALRQTLSITAEAVIEETDRLICDIRAAEKS